MVNTQPKEKATPLPNPTRVLELVPVIDDVIEYTIACALALSPPDVRAEVRAHIAQHASGQARRIFGGDRVYISRRLGEGTSQRNAAIKRDYWQKGEHIPLLERRYGLSSSHLWRIIKS
jgi:Mor family transcriptional regulator